MQGHSMSSHDADTPQTTAVLSSTKPKLARPFPQLDPYSKVYEACRCSMEPFVAFSSFSPLRNVKPPHRTWTCVKDVPLCAIAFSKPARVGIAGAGIAGLSTALSLLKTPNTGVKSVTIYEPRDSVDFRQGAALNINGAAAILLRYGIPLWKIGNPMRSVVARTVNGRTLFNVHIDEALGRSASAAETLVVDGNPTFMTVMRDELQLMLTEQLQTLADIRRGKQYSVTGIRPTSRGGRFIFADGSESDEYDLLVGADGVRSQVRDFVSENITAPRSTRLRVQWAICPQGTTTLPPGVVEQWFGDGCYVLRYAGGTGRQVTEMLAVSYQQKSAGNVENITYVQSDLKADIGKRLARADMPKQIMDVFQRAERFIGTSVYQHDVLPNWSRGGFCTLVGDSAHAMPPHLGQGANQAVQDAFALSLAVSEIGHKHRNLNDALSSYQRIRQGPVTAILRTSGAVGYLETQKGFPGTAFRNNLFRIMGQTGAVERVFLQAATPRS